MIFLSVVKIMIILSYVADALKVNIGLPFFISSRRDKLKSDILKLARQTQRGLTEDSNEKKRMRELFEELEGLNPNKLSLSSKLVNAVWLLEYTTSDSILGRGGDPRIGPILQAIDAEKLRAENSEVVRYFNALNIPRKVTAELKPLTSTKVAVQFKKFTVGPFSFNAPASFKGELDITYVDDGLRLSRGDKGNIFVLTRYSDLE